MKNTKNKLRKISKCILGSALLFSSFSLLSCEYKNKQNEDKEKLEEVIRQNQELNAQIVSLNEQIQSVTNLYNEILALKAEMEASKNQDIDSLNAKVSELNSTINGLNGLIANLENQIDEKTETINSLNNDKSSLTDEINQLLSTLKSLKDDAEKQIQDLNAQIIELNKQIETFLSYTITFNTNGGSTIKPLTIRKDDKIPKPADPTRAGYKFTGWTCSTGEDWNFDKDTVHFDVTFDANWSPLTYTIDYDLSGGTFTDPSSAIYSIVYDTDFTLPGVSKTDYTLHNWECDGETVSNGAWEIAKNATLKCVWAKNVSKITYKFNCEGMPEEQQTCQYGELFKLKAPTRIGYTFKGWEYNGSFISSGTWKYLDDIVLEGVWEANKYDFILNPGDGVLDQTSVKVTYDSNFTLPVPQNLSEERPFAGWWSGKTRITDEKGEAYEKWTNPYGLTVEAKFFYPISTVDEFLAINDNPSAVYCLINDLDFENTEISPLSETFTGELWGMGYSLKNISFAKDQEKVGLFAHVENASFKDINFIDSTISFSSEAEGLNYQIGLISPFATGECCFEDLTYSNVNIDVTNNSSKLSVGGLVGSAENLILNNVTIDGTFSGISSGNSVDIGGFAGNVSGNISATDSTNKSNVICNAYGGINEDNETLYEGNAGGLAGTANNINLVSFYNDGKVEGYSLLNDSSYTGGFAGKLIGEQTIVTSSNKGEVVATGIGGGLIGLVCQDLEFTGGINEGALSDNGESAILGGLFGKCLGITAIFDSYNVGSITTTSGYAGGLIGLSADTISFSKSHNEGDVAATNGKSGGLLGIADSELTLSNSYNTGSISGNSLSGGLVAEANSNVYISYSHNEGIITSSGTSGGLLASLLGELNIEYSYNTGDVSGSNLAGGLVGDTTELTTITNSYNDGAITSTSGMSGGLLVSSKNELTIQNSHNIGTISGSTFAGGLLASTEGISTISDSYNEGSVTSVNGTSGGLLASSKNELTIQNSYNNGVISGGAFAGGLVAETLEIASISNSYNMLNVSSENGNAGGLIAEAKKTATISTCYNSGTVSANNNSGGLIGIADSYINHENIYNTGNVTSNNIAGGLFGFLSKNINLVNCYNEGSISGKLISGGLIGFNDDEFTMSDCYNKGDVESFNGVASGLVGKVSGQSEVVYSYNEGTISGSMYSSGIIGICEEIARLSESYNIGSIISNEGSAGGLTGLTNTVIIKDCYNSSSILGKIYAGGLLAVDNGSSIISYCFVSGTVGFVSDDVSNLYAGGFIGEATICSVSFGFITADLVGDEEYVNTIVGEYETFTSNKVVSSSSLFGFDDEPILEGEKQATIVLLDTLTALYIKNELYFNSVDSAWLLDDVDLVNGDYPLLAYFVVEEEPIE